MQWAQEQAEIEIEKYKEKAETAIHNFIIKVPNI